MPQVNHRWSLLFCVTAGVVVSAPLWGAEFNLGSPVPPAVSTSSSASTANNPSVPPPTPSTTTAPAPAVTTPPSAPASTTTVPSQVKASTAALPGMIPALEEKHPSRFAHIVKVGVEGNINLRERAILAQVKTRKGDLYDPEILRKDVQAIYGMGNFDDVTLDVSDVPGGLAVTFKVVEKPLIKKIEFKGNKKLSKGKLSDTITLKENDPLDKLKLNLDVDKLIDLYKDEGFAAAQVEPYTTTDTTHHVTVTFFVTEGIQVLVDTVTLEGVQSFPAKKILKLMKTRRKKVFKQDQLTKDLDEITKFYKNHGHPNVKVGEVKQTFSADKTRLTLNVPIQEGPLMHFGTVDFSGNLVFQSDKLKPAIQYKGGDIFEQEKLDATISKLQDTYGAQGYIRVQIKPDLTQDTTQQLVNVTFHVDEGEVVYVDHIDIEGNTHTKDYVIRREIRLKEGEPFSSVKARKSVERLYNLGFLDNVDVDVQQPTSPNKADVIFTVTEGKPGMLSAGAGFSSVNGLIGTLQVQHINFLGRGQRVNLQWQFGGRINSLDLGWTEPWFMGKPISFGADVFKTMRIMQLGTDLNAYDSHNLGASVTVGPRFSDEVYSLLFTYLYADTIRDTVDPNLDPADQTLILGSTNTTSFHAIKSNLTEQLIRDTRDNQFDPTRGTKTSLALTEGGLGFNSVEYNKAILDGSVHIPTFWKFVLSVHTQWGIIKPYGSSTLTDIVDDLFHIGGADTVRGYELGQVGVTTGGQVENFYNVEYKFPIAPDEHGKTLLQGVFFYDVGGSWDNLSDVSYRIGGLDTSLRQGVGFGIRFKTPVFPLRLDYGFALNRPPGQAPSQFYFNVGSLF